jgi:signal transduction histidine kinase
LVELLRAGTSLPGGGFQYLQVVDSSGAIRATAGQLSDEPGGCGERGISVLARREVPAGPDGWTLAGGYRVGQTIDREGLPNLSVYDRDGELVFSSDCEGSSARMAPLVRTDGSIGTVRLGEGPDRTFGVYAPVGNLGWTVLATAPNALRGPIGRMFRNYWLFVLLLGGATVLAFSLLLGRVTRSLEELTVAVERVGAGDLRPWLPPPDRDEVGRLTIAISEMTDGLRETMKRADRSGRLAVVGQLASYLAHEIRNPLSSVKMNLQRLQRWERAGQIPERAREPIDVSLREVDRLSIAVSNVLQLSRAPDKPLEVVSVHDLVTEVGMLLDGEFARAGLHVHWELDAAADRILGRPGQLKGVVINLMLNALDAQPGGGELRIRSVLTAGSPDQPGPRLELRFKDAGPGVPEEIRDRIFEPFFTTKKTGSGIGLAVASQTVRESQGLLFLDDPPPDGGAEFVISFPLAPVSPHDLAPDADPALPSWMEPPETTDVGAPDGRALGDGHPGSRNPV